MLHRFHKATQAIEDINYAINRASYRVNMLLTINTGRIAVANSADTARTLERMTTNMRNQFRGRRHRFRGLWRREFGGPRYGGDHHHLLFHGPRGFRSELVERLPAWTGDSIDPHRSSKCYRGTRWQVGSMARLWHLERVYNVPDLLEYLAKVPISNDGIALSRGKRCEGFDHCVREFAVFGV